MPDNIHSQDDNEDFDVPVRPFADQRTLHLPPEESDDESESAAPSKVSLLQ